MSWSQPFCGVNNMIVTIRTDVKFGSGVALSLKVPGRRAEKQGPRAGTLLLAKETNLKDYHWNCPFNLKTSQIKIPNPRSSKRKMQFMRVFRGSRPMGGDSLTASRSICLNWARVSIDYLTLLSKALAFGSRQYLMSLKRRENKSLGRSRLEPS